MDAGLRDLGAEHSELEHQLQAAYISAASHVRDLAPEASRRRHRLLERIGGTADAQERAAIAHSVVQDSLRGASRSDVRGLTEIAWADGAFLEHDPRVDPSLSCLASALMFVDEIERDLEICEMARTGPHRISAPVVSHFRAWPLYERGQIAEATTEAKAALDAPDDFHTTIRTAYATLACCHLLRGDLAHAETALAIVEDPQSGRPFATPCSLRSGHVSGFGSTGRRMPSTTRCAPANCLSTNTASRTRAPSPGGRPRHSRISRSASRLAPRSSPPPSSSAPSGSTSRG